jgi:hypothetical protein
MVTRNLRQRLYDEDEYTVGFLCPDYKGFLQLMDKFFLEPLTKAYDKKKADEERLQREEEEKEREKILERMKRWDNDTRVCQGQWIW